jgi:hypothetical protein
VLVVLKSGSLNLLEPSGPVQACSGIALLFYSELIGWDVMDLTWDRARWLDVVCLDMVLMVFGDRVWNCWCSVSLFGADAVHSSSSANSVN